MATQTDDQKRGYINITNNGNMQLGQHNHMVVQPQHSNVQQVLIELKVAVQASDLPAEQKQSVVGDLATIESPMTKPKPNYNIIKQFWLGIEKSVLIGTLIDLTRKFTGQ